MEKETVMQIVEEIFQDVFDDKNLVLSETTNANDIEGWDSLTHITILEAVQDEFGIQFSLDEMIELNDVGKMVEAIVRERGCGEECQIKEPESSVWNASYDKGGNICFYPHEEIVRFVNRFVRKRRGIHTFENIMPLLSSKTPLFHSLDLGCGIGRHIKFLDEFNLNPYGIDLSETAIGIGKEWMRSIGKEYLSDRMFVANVTALPFEDNYFGICVSHGVLDSMPREIAIQGMKEVRRVLQPGAFMYLDLIMDIDKHEGDEIVKEGYETGTVQSYFTADSIMEFLSEFDIIDFNIISNTDEKGMLRNKRAHLVIKNSKKE